METRDDVLNALADRRYSIRELGVTELGVFGSFAGNEQRPDSDVDVLVEMKSRSFDAYMNLLFFLEDLLGRKVDLVGKDTIKPMIRSRVLRETPYVANI